MSDELKAHLKERKTWLRGLYMLLFAILYTVAEVVITAVVVFQFLLALFTGNSNERLLKLGQSLSTYVYQILQFLTFNSNYYPYPFGAWPKGTPKESANQSKVAGKEGASGNVKEIEQPSDKKES
jgi:hypothetical protein